MAMTNKEWTKHTTEAVAAESGNRSTTLCRQSSAVTRARADKKCGRRRVYHP
jgi:hypothetical protein